MAHKVNTTQRSNTEIMHKLDDLVEIIEPQLKAEFQTEDGETLEVGSLNYGGYHGRLLDGGFLTLEGGYPLDMDQYFALIRWIDSTARDVGLGGAYHLNANIPALDYDKTGVLLFRVYCK